MHDPRGAEPEFGGWEVVPLGTLVDLVLRAVGAPVGRAPVLAIDGRGSSGKTTLAGRLAAAVPGTAVLHTDDVAWWHSPFGWADLLADGVLEPLRRGERVAFRPPAWEARGRPGAIEAAPDAALVVVEGVGAGRRELAHLLDAVLWVHADLGVTERRDAVRVAAGEIGRDAYAEWMAQEHPFVADQRAWERAVAVVHGTPHAAHDVATEVVLARGGRAA